MQIGFDLDGTLYNSLDPILQIDNAILGELGYAPISKDTYRAHFSSKDWIGFLRRLGIKEEHTSIVVDEFKRRWDLTPVPELIPGAQQVLEQALDTWGAGVHVITNEPRPRVQKRFDRDGLAHLLDRVKAPYQGKASELYELAMQEPSKLFLYIGDLVADGEDCLEARERGARNIEFCAITHAYSMNHASALEAFVGANSSFAQAIPDLAKVPQMWQR